MSSISILTYHPEDETDIEEITFKTGFKGEDLTGRAFCDDSKLWFLIFIAYYTWFEPQHFFVAVDSAVDKVAGFICGTPDTCIQESQFQRHIIPRVVLRLFLYTSWRYPRSFRQILRLAHQFSNKTIDDKDRYLTEHYPAHMHINILPTYQSVGVGTQLFTRFEQHLLNLGVSGLHLKTTNQNIKAVPFYQKMGFTIYHESDIIPHHKFNDLKELIFVKSYIELV